MNRWTEKDLKYNWHPYTQMKDCLKNPPVLIEKARGLKLYDDKGNFYYDTISSWWCNVHGHNHPRINKAIKKQLEKLDHTLFAGFTHKSAILLAEKLVWLTPKSLTKVFFSDDGSTAVETAMKISFQYWKNIGKSHKTKFASLDHGYHGDTIGAMSVSGVDLFNNVFKSLFFDSFKAPSPYCYRCPVGKSKESCNIDCIKPLDALLRKKADEIAAFIIEPIVMAAGGMIIYPAQYLARAAKIAKTYGVHLIVDEVATAFGRTGRMFASEHACITPDLMCLSKGLTAGYLPMGATLVSEEIYHAFYTDYEDKKTFYHGHTYTANALACSVALESLRIFEDEGTLGKAKALFPIFHKGLERFRTLPIVGDVRYIGMIGALELVKDKRKKTPFTFGERIGLEVYKRALENNLILRPLGNIVYFFLPLSINAAEIEDILKRTHSVISAL